MRQVAGAIILLAASILLIAGIVCEQHAQRSPYPLLYVAAVGATILGLVLIFKDDPNRRY